MIWNYFSVRKNTRDNLPRYDGVLLLLLPIEKSQPNHKLMDLISNLVTKEVLRKNNMFCLASSWENGDIGIAFPVSAV